MFKLSLSKEARDFLDAQQNEADRLYRLNNRWLAEAILRLARAARKETPHLTPDAYVYDNTFVWHVLPELARRLGASGFEKSEREDYDINHISDIDLRARTAGCIANISSAAHHRMPAWSLLLREPANGNPAVYAVDRLAPGDLKHPDSLVKRLSEIASIRKVAYDGVWTPLMMNYA